MLTCVQVLLGLSKFTPFPLSHFIEALVLVGGTVVNKEGGWCELKCCSPQRGIGKGLPRKRGCPSVSLPGGACLALGGFLPEQGL